MINRSRPSLSGALGNVITALLLAALPAVAQQRAAGAVSSNDQSRAGDKSSADPKPEASSQSGISNDRLFYVLPDFLTVHAAQLPPLSVGQKFRVVARMSLDPVEYPYYALLAGVSQARNSERGYGQGATGYGKRYGAMFADGTIEGFMTGAILPSLLREDPRYYLMGKGTFWHRTAYAISRIFVTRTDSGHGRFNFSEILGAGLSAGISTYSYHPRGDRNLANAASVWGSLVGDDTLGQVVTEFWPDLRRKLSHKTHRGSVEP
jgi:hypothetical protein